MDFVISLNNPLVRIYMVYSSILIMKMLMMSLYTIKHGLKLKKKGDGNKKSAKVSDTDLQDINRVRRAHLNDLENIPAFLFISALYLATNPPVSTATILMIAYTATRIIHSLVYAVWVVPQPARGISWAIGYVITFYMAITVLLQVL